MSEAMNHGRTFEVLSAEPLGKRRRPKLRSDEDKALILEEALVPGANVSAVARAHGMHPSQLFGWRRAAIASGALRRLDEAAAGSDEAFTRFEAVRTDFVEIWVCDVTLRVSSSIEPALLSGIIRAVRQA